MLTVLWLLSLISLLEMNNDSIKSLEIMPKNEIELQERQSIASSISPNSSGNQQDDSMDNAEQMEVAEKAENEIGLHERQSISSSITPDTSGNQQDDSNDDAGQIDATESENLPLNETNSSTDTQSEVEGSIPKDDHREFDGCTNGIKRIGPSFIFDVALPSVDVYSDLSLVIPWYWNGHLKYAASMTAPLVFQFASTVYKWFRLEKRESKRWSWPILLLQCWPQWRAIRIMHLDFRNDDKAEDEKKELMREITTTEPFLEAWPSIIVMTIIYVTTTYDDSFSEYCNRNKLWSSQANKYDNRTWTCHGDPDSYDLPIEYCNIQPQNSKCAVYSGPGGFVWFLVTFVLSIISGSLGITKFLQNGPFSVLPTDGLLGGICKCRFILAVSSVLGAMITKGVVIGNFVVLSLSKSEPSTALKRTLGTSESGETLIVMLLILFLLLIIPNMILSFISISCSTGLNKKFLRVVLNYPATWMLPIITYFTIGPNKSNCCSQTNHNRSLVFSKYYSGINTLLTITMQLAVLISFDTTFDFLLSYLRSYLPLGLACNVIFLTIDKKCCCSKRCKQDGVTIHVMDVEHDDLKIVSIENH